MSENIKNIQENIDLQLKKPRYNPNDRNYILEYISNDVWKKEYFNTISKAWNRYYVLFEIYKYNLLNNQKNKGR